MIRLNKMISPERTMKLECESVDDALTHFDADAKFVIARCDTDEEWTGLDVAITAKNEGAVAAANLARAQVCPVWQPRINLAEGAGWRTFWAQGLLQAQPQQAPQMPMGLPPGMMGMPNGGMRGRR